MFIYNQELRMYFCYLGEYDSGFQFGWTTNLALATILTEEKAVELVPKIQAVYSYPQKILIKG